METDIKADNWLIFKGHNERQRHDYFGKGIRTAFLAEKKKKWMKLIQYAWKLIDDRCEMIEEQVAQREREEHYFNPGFLPICFHTVLMMSFQSALFLSCHKVLKTFSWIATAFYGCSREVM